MENALSEKCVAKCNCSHVCLINLANCGPQTAKNTKINFIGCSNLGVLSKNFTKNTNSTEWQRLANMY